MEKWFVRDLFPRMIGWLWLWACPWFNQKTVWEKRKKLFWRSQFIRIINLRGIIPVNVGFILNKDCTYLPPGTFKLPPFFKIIRWCNQFNPLLLPYFRENSRLVQPGLVRNLPIKKNQYYAAVPFV
jgi:hypothetical protein